MSAIPDTSLSAKQPRKKGSAKRCKNCGHEQKRLYMQIGYIKRGVGWACWRCISRASRYKTMKRLDYNRVFRVDQHVHLVGK